MLHYMYGDSDGKNDSRMFCLMVLSFVAGAFAAPDSTYTSTTIDVVAAFTQAFNIIDLDHNGQVDVQEFFKVFDSYDSNHDNKMTLQEYITATKTDPALAKEVFKFVDSDGDNVIDRRDTNRVFRLYDSNHDGVINVQEFISEYTKIYQQIMTDLPLGIRSTTASK